jgi:hypothetical protein
MGKKSKNADFLDLPDPDAEEEQQEASQAAAKPTSKKKGGKKGGKPAKFADFGDSGRCCGRTD